MQQYLRWSCGFNYSIVMLTLKWFVFLRLMTQPSEIALELKIANPSKVTTYFKVSNSDYLPPDTTFFLSFKVFYIHYKA